MNIYLLKARIHGIGKHSRLTLSTILNLLVCCETRRDNQTKTRILIVRNVSFCIGIFWAGQVSFPGINRELKHDVYGRRQMAKVTYDFLFFSCSP